MDARRSLPVAFRVVVFRLFVMAAAFSFAADAQTVTRIKQNDPSIAYSGTWYANASLSNSGGSAALTNAKGAQAVLSFNGTGVTWIGVLDPGNGIAYVFLDGQMSTIDCYGPNTQYQQQMFVARGLAAGPHTLSIGVPHIRDANGSGSWVWIDSFLVENGAVIAGGVVAGAGRAEQTSPAITYTGVWFTDSAANLSGGSAVLSTDTNSSVSINFNGSSITWLAYRDQWSGIASVYLDGAFQATVDTFLSPAQSQAPMYSASGLPPGTHTLTIQVTGTHSAASNDSWVWVDAFNIAGAASVAPAISASGVVNAASYAPSPNNRIAPGQIVSIFGSNFLASGRADSSTLPLATQLGSSNASVTACSRSIPLYTVLPGQINAQVPWECPTTGVAQFTVTANGQTSAAQSINLVAMSPGIFTASASGTGDGAILHADNSLVTHANPARGGETVVVYGTGLGPTVPAFASGSAAAGSNTTMNTVTASIGGKPAGVVYSGMTNGFVGLYQVNVVVPPGLSGSQAITVAVAGSTSQFGVTLSVIP